MKITRKQFNTLVERYLYEQEAEDDGAPPDDEVEAPPDSESEENTDQDVEAEAEADDQKTGDDLPEKFKPFDILFDNVKHTIQFVKDASLNILKLKIDDQEIKNPQPQDFVTLAGIGLGGVDDKDLEDQLSKVVKIDVTFKKTNDTNTLKNLVKGKLAGSRKGFSESDIRKILDKRNRWRISFGWYT